METSQKPVKQINFFLNQTKISNTIYEGLSMFILFTLSQKCQTISLISSNGIEL